MDDVEYRRWADRIERAHAALATSNYYDVLGVPPAASQDEIRQAFHRRAVQLHPDRHRATPEPERGRVYAVFKRMTEAFRVLVDPELREAYDRGLAAGQLRLTDEGSRRPKSHEDLLRTPAGKRHYQIAAQAMAHGDMQAAVLNVQLAISHEGEVPFLIEMARELRQSAPPRKSAAPGPKPKQG